MHWPCAGVSPGRTTPRWASCSTRRRSGTWTGLGPGPGGAAGRSARAGRRCRPGWPAAGPTGQVLATDIDISALQDAPEPGFEILRHDVSAEPAPLSGLDLVHARLVLMHVADRDAALTAMTGALRPGGWLLAEEADLSLQPLACPMTGRPGRAAGQQAPADRDRVTRRQPGLRPDPAPAAAGRGPDRGRGRRPLPGRGRRVRAAAADDDRAPAGAPDRGGPGHRGRDRPAPGGHRRARLDVATFTVVSAWGRKAP